MPPGATRKAALETHIQSRSEQILNAAEAAEKAAEEERAKRMEQLKK